MSFKLPAQVIDIILDDLRVGLTIADNKGNVIYCNELAAELLGWQKPPARNTILQCHSPELQDKIVAKMNDTGGQKLWHKIINLNGRYLENTFFPILIPKDPTALILMTRDVTEREEAIELMKKSANTDLMTGLYNKNYFDLVFKDSVQMSDDFGLIKIDLSGIKYINDHFGQEAGDKIIVRGAQVIKDCLRTSDLVFRVEGDKFLVLVANSEVKILQQVCRRIQNKTEIPTTEKPLVLHMSIGYCSSKEVDDLEDVIKLADQRMMENKILFYANEGKFLKD